MPQRTVYLETFGCQMNELDSELVSGALRALGYRFTPDADQAQVVLYNTCSVRDHAEQKVRSRLGEMQLRKHREPALVVGVLGCMAERDGPDMLRRFPVVDVLCGPAELDKLPALLDNAVRTRQSLASDEPPPEVDENTGRAFHAAAERSARQVALQGDASRRSSTLAAAQDTLELLDLSRSVSPADHRGSAYVRITRGCNKFCTYCVVPHTRGAEVHRPPEHIIDECRRLADAGVIEVTLLGQTVNHYRFEHGAAVTLGGVAQPQKGRSYKGGHRRDPFAGERVTTFADLLRRIHDEVPAIRRLRFVTSYPRDFGDDVLEVIRDHPRICRYLHVPAQSGSDAVLKRMNRGYTVGEYLEFIDRARAHLHQPEIGRPLTLAGDIIVGFCGETEADFAATADLLRAVRYKNCFIFKYSPRPGTAAFDSLPDDVPEADKRRRCNELLAVQHAISDDISRSYVGATIDVFVEGVSARERKKSRPAAAAPPAAREAPRACAPMLEIIRRQPPPGARDQEIRREIRRLRALPALASSPDTRDRLDALEKQLAPEIPAPR
ncbi:MAG: MiaB/RimO family radical SAM methylthiotransferase [Phycisphaerales bacterium]|nr:MiaB/RimO family radical SAM methylthiotransferase [Phycisphaerales bacterium]